MQILVNDTRKDETIGVLLIFFQKRDRVGGICPCLIWAWKECSELVTVLPIVWVEFLAIFLENDLTPADEQESKQPNSRNRDSGADLICCLPEQKAYREPHSGQAAGSSWL